ncbi:MAG: hypothetical protein ACFFD4_02465 [Candidatus Odinarchaeota archaeon]
MMTVVMRSHCHVVPGCENCGQASTCPDIDYRIELEEEYFRDQDLEPGEPLMLAMILGDSSDDDRKRAKELLQLYLIKKGSDAKW